MCVLGQNGCYCVIHAAHWSWLRLHALCTMLLLPSKVLHKLLWDKHIIIWFYISIKSTELNDFLLNDFSLRHQIAITVSMKNYISHLSLLRIRICFQKVVWPGALPTFWLPLDSFGSENSRNWINLWSYTSVSPAIEQWPIEKMNYTLKVIKLELYGCVT